jgi:hypothetical protein
VEQALSLIGEAKGEAIPVDILRNGKKLKLTAKPGKFGTSIENRPLPPAAGVAPTK